MNIQFKKDSGIKVVELDPRKRYAILVPEGMSTGEFDEINRKMKKIDGLENIELLMRENDGLKFVEVEAL